GQGGVAREAGLSEGVGQPLSIGESLADQQARLVWIAETPQRPRAIVAADHARIFAIDQDLGARLVDIPKIDGQTKIFPAWLKLAAKQQGTALRPMSERSTRIIILRIRHRHQFGAQMLRLGERLSLECAIPEAAQDGQ